MAIRRLEGDDFAYEYPQGRPYIPEIRDRITPLPDFGPVKVYHIPPRRNAEREIPDAYPELDTDLARDNLENDLTEADRQDVDNV